MASDHQWYELKNTQDLITPALLLYPERVRQNALKMIDMAGGTERLRPHVKTHKMAEIIDMQMQMGIQKFKCATIPEAELLARCGAKDVLLAMQPVGIQIRRLFQLVETYPETSFSTLVDNTDSVAQIKKEVRSRGVAMHLWLDLNNGMNRTGIIPGAKAVNLYKSLANDPEVILRGMPLYDGHIRTSDPDLRKQDCDRDFKAVSEMQKALENDGCTVTDIITGGSPTFPVHAQRKHTELSPGTVLLWDAGYASKFADLRFDHAAVLASRIVSKPAENLLCFDLGHKAVASEMPLPRVHFLGDYDFEQISQSEEHLVVRCPNNEIYDIGQVFYAIPVHICPTVSKYPRVLTVAQHKITGSWKVAARDHVMTHSDH